MENLIAESKGAGRIIYHTGVLIGAVILND
jgi:hypothetical protein